MKTTQVVTLSPEQMQRAVSDATRSVLAALEDKMKSPAPPVRKAGARTGFNETERQLAADLVNRIDGVVAEVIRLRKENDALLKISAEATAVMKRAIEERRTENAELALLGQQMQKILSMPVPGRAPIRNMHAAEQILKSATPRETEVLRQAAAGAPPAVREYLLHEANAIERNK